MEMTTPTINASHFKYNKSLPEFVRRDVDHEAQDWKNQFFDGFKKALIDDEHVDWGLAMSSVRIFHR